MSRLKCKVDTWRISPPEDDRTGAEVRLDIWIDGGSRCGRIVGCVIEVGSDPPRFQYEPERDDFDLPPHIANAIMLEAYLLIGQMPGHVDGTASDPFDFEPWLAQRWSKLRARSLARMMEATIRSNVPEPEASGGVPRG